MICIFNPDRLTRPPFFRQLINYLHSHEAPTLRQIKQAFPEVKGMERSLEEWIQAGYIRRQDRRYSLAVPLLEAASQVQLDQLVFADTASTAYQELMALRFETRLPNGTNQAVLAETTDFARRELTLANYFHKLAAEEPLSPEQERLYAILGDVNPEYALKYLTTFLLKFSRKDLVKQKRPDIFVDSLLVLGYLEQAGEQTYALTMDFDLDSLTFRSRQ